jgi:hypothetical protein
MANQVNLGQRLELRDPSGSTLGYFLPTKEFEQCCGKDLKTVQELLADRQQLELTVKKLMEERDGLRDELVKLVAERDQYLHSLYALTRQEFTLQPEELVALEANGLTLGQIIEQIENPGRP